MSTLLSTTRASLTGCVEFSGLFQDPLLEEPPTTGASAEVRRRSADLEREADALCRACPVLQQCLYAAVVHHDVAGFVAGTTRKMRLEMRTRLAVSVEPEDFDTLAGVTRHHRQVDHDEVVRLRHANPHESLEQLAQRLGCSLSTVKRHLRHERQAPAVRRLGSRLLPTQAQVMDAYAAVSAGRRGDHVVAA
jgi:predicted DNA-binding transcriptional regulator AlpA